MFGFGKLYALFGAGKLYAISDQPFVKDNDYPKNDFFPRPLFLIGVHGVDGMYQCKQGKRRHFDKIYL